jgi:hypothetical protein
VAAILSASLFPLQIIQAERFIEQVKAKPELKPNASWDGSVISLLNYPDVLKMMNEDLTWTEELGTAVANQQKKLLAAIQQLRERAVANKIVESNDQVKVERNAEQSIIIQPVKEEITYVPVYEEKILLEPDYVPTQPIYYGDPYPSYYYPYAPFWPGFVAGAIWGSVIDWGDGDCWGGDVDIDIGDINIDRDKFTNIDRNNISNIDRSRDNLNFDRSKISEGVKKRPENRLDKKSGTGVERQRDLVNKAGVGTRDVRRDVQQGLQRPDGRPGIESRPSGGQARPDRPQGPKQGARADRPQAKQSARPSGKPAARPDTRPRQPSALGDYSRGSNARISSQRGHSSSMGRGGGGGAPRFSGGGGRGGGGGRR